VDSITMMTRPHSWRAVDDSTLIVWATPFHPYLVELAYPSHDLRFSEAIGLSQTGSRVYAKFDRVWVRGFSYPISGIYKMTREERKGWGGIGSERTGEPTGLRVLVIEDDKDVASFIRKGLVQEGCNVDLADNGKDGLLLATTESYDALIVDRMLPGVDGLTVIRTLRASGNRTPVLILSALGEVDDRVRGLKAGGDDYLVKPFAFSELLARIEALVRRAQSTTEQPVTVLRVADLELDLLRREARRGRERTAPQPREFQLLEFLMRHAGQVVTRTMLLEGVWNYHFDPQTNVIDVHISRLRSKIDRGFDRQLLHTVRGAGYRLDAA